MAQAVLAVLVFAMGASVPLAPRPAKAVPTTDWDQTVLVKCSPTEIVEGDGTECKTITVKNGTASNGTMSVHVEWANGTKVDDVLSAQASKTYTCHITLIQVHETTASPGLVQWHF